MFCGEVVVTMASYHDLVRSLVEFWSYGCVSSSIVCFVECIAWVVVGMISNVTLFSQLLSHGAFAIAMTIVQVVTCCDNIGAGTATGEVWWNPPNHQNRRMLRDD